MNKKAVLVILKEEAILMINNDGNNILLPTIALPPSSDNDSIVKEFLDSKFKGSTYNIFSTKNIESYKNSNEIYYLIDLKNADKSSLTLDRENLSWSSLAAVYNLHYSISMVIKDLIKECINTSYETESIFALAHIVSNRLGLGNAFSNYKLQIENEKLDAEVPFDKKLIYMALCSILGIMFVTFYYKYIGISQFIFVAAILITFIVMTSKFNIKNFNGTFFLLISLLLSISYSIFTNPVFRILNFLIIPFTLLIAFLFYYYEILPFRFYNILGLSLKKVISEGLPNSLKMPKFLMDKYKDTRNSTEKASMKNVRNGILISIPTVIFLAILLSGADSVFAYYIGNLASFFDNWNVTYITKFISGVMVAFYSFGFFWSLRHKNYDSYNTEVKKTFHPTTIIILLISITALYGFFTKIQFTSLYGGNHHYIPGGLTYSEYARSGFFQLVFITVINVLGILFLKLKTMEISEKFKQILNILLTINTLFTFNMLVSAFYKMRLYIEVMGYTRLRVLVSLFIIFLFITLLLLITYIWKNFNIFKPAVITALVLYVFINFSNIDSFIADKNITLYSQGNKVSPDYLTMLSLDAAAPIKEGYDKGIISKEVYQSWLNTNRNESHSWYEYNYYVERYMNLTK